MYFKHNNLHKYTREGRDQEEEKIRRRRNRLEYLQSVKVGKEMGRGLSDQYDVLRKIKLISKWIKSECEKDVNGNRKLL